MNSQDYAKIIIERVSAVLKPLGFKKKGQSFSADREDVVLLIQLQKSRRTTRDTLIITVNLGVLSRGLASKLNQTLDGVSVPGSHWWLRLGSLPVERDDSWWEVSGPQEAIRASEKIADLLQSYGLPALEKVSSTAKLRALWESGECPGLTEKQRQDYLSALTE